MIPATESLLREHHAPSDTHCARCREPFEDVGHERDGYCEYCLDKIEGYERDQAELAWEYDAPGTHRRTR